MSETPSAEFHWVYSQLETLFDHVIGRLESSGMDVQGTSGNESRMTRFENAIGPFPSEARDTPFETLATNAFFERLRSHDSRVLKNIGIELEMNDETHMVTLYVYGDVWT